MGRCPAGDQNEQWVNEDFGILCPEDTISNLFFQLSFSQIFLLPGPQCSLSLGNEVLKKMTYVGPRTHSHLFSALWPVVNIFMHCCPLQKKAVWPSLREVHIYGHELKCWEVNLTLCPLGKIQYYILSKGIWPPWP